MWATVLHVHSLDIHYVATTLKSYFKFKFGKYGSYMNGGNVSVE